MNYLAEIVAFESWLENGGYLAYGVQTVWYRLMWLNNKCGWQEWFQVDNQRLMVATQIRNEKTLIRYRDRLIEAGLLEYRKGKKGSPNQYRIIPLSKNTVNNTVETTVKRTVKEGVKRTVEVSDIYKYKTKTKTKKNIAKAISKKEPVAYDADPVVDAAVLDFVDHRRSLKKPMTDKAIELFLAKLEKLSGGDSSMKKALIDEAIERGWQTVYPLKSEVQGESAKPEDRFSHLLIDEGSEEE